MDINKSNNEKSDEKDDKQYFFDNPKNTKWVMNIFYACCVLVVVLDFVINRHVYHSWENLPAFYPIYGFVGCVVLVVIASWMRTFLMRSEDYYDKSDDKGCDHPDDDHDQEHLEKNNDENTHKGASNQTENKKIGDHNVDA
ncbi:hypothetical protein FM038_019845 [Shewanella eurypsychrophilus]|uniref:Uncharacterized protein n=1 Tax=Shewanella eurypsychrophilus TaxID=2593656 RepID=A0ABX6VA38_9GAMM|nr:MULTISPECIES: hypothetical protein [Shewanella]QFU24180.1 hypothetical protein FS418_21570 [Shewanella sp. YLB-09]QPG59386.1 hypothetical protein FM038_019845 [Shewanella eurypsychrophilus]